MDHTKFIQNVKLLIAKRLVTTSTNVIVTAHAPQDAFVNLDMYEIVKTFVSILNNVVSFLMQNSSSLYGNIINNKYFSDNSHMYWSTRSPFKLWECSLSKNLRRL